MPEPRPVPWCADPACTLPFNHIPHTIFFLGGEAARASSTLDLDGFYDEAFPNDPYLSGVMRAEVDRMRSVVFVQHDLGDGLACRHCGASGMALSHSCEGPSEPGPFDSMTICGECGQAVGTEEVHSHD